MRTLIIPALALTAALAACASTGGGKGRVTAETDDLRAQCESRGGMFLPSGTVTGFPAVDNFCELRDSDATRTR